MNGPVGIVADFLRPTLMWARYQAPPMPAVPWVRSHPRWPLRHLRREAARPAILAFACCGLLLPTGLALGIDVAPSSEAVSSLPMGAALNSSWQNITGAVGPGPSDRSVSQAAYFPPLNATILFGGYYGVGGNIPLGDTWKFANDSWTEIFPSLAPSPRWGAAMVYDPEMRGLLLFGGRNDTNFLNDTWEFNATGWHELFPVAAPSVRYDFGMAFDNALGEVVLYGGGIGNVPAGTFTGFTYYTDTWTFQDAAWTNVTASAGPGPVGRLLRGQMAYDAADGYVVLAGGYEYVPLATQTSCGYVIFNSTWGDTWTFDGRWTKGTPGASSPPDGVGVIWFDSGANETLYYEGMWRSANSTNGSFCDASGDEVWSYAAGNWTLVTEGPVWAPAPTELPVVFDDLLDQQQIVFGGEYAVTASEFSASYLNDTWTYQPTWVTFAGQPTPSGSEWNVTVNGTRNESAGRSILFVQAPGTYSYEAKVVTARGAVLATSGGKYTLAHQPAVVVLTYRGSRTVPPPASPWATAWGTWGAALGGASAGATAIAALVWAGGARRKTRLRKDGEGLVQGMLQEPGSPERPRRK